VSTYEALRWLLFGAAATSLLLYSWIYFDAFRARSWPERLARFGVGGVLFTVAAAQIKFLVEPYPFGWPPKILLGFLVLTIVGQAWMIRRPEHRH